MLPNHRALLALLIAVCASRFAGAGPPPPGRVSLPDPSTGQINGRVAVMFWPSRLTARPLDREPDLLSADGCEVHLVPHTDANQELKYPCGEWFQPKAGRYNVWLERGDAISPAPTVMSFSDAPFKGRGMAVVEPVGEAGYVGVPPGHPVAANERLRLIRADGPPNGGQGRAFERRVATSAAFPVRMPAGRVIVGRFDKDSGEALALARPVSVAAGKTVNVWPELPPRGGDLLAVIEKPPTALTATGDSKPTFTIETEAGARPPDVLIDSFERVIGIWYAVPTGRMYAVLQAPDYFWKADVSMREGRVSTVRAKAGNRPSLRTSINLLSGNLPEASLEISRAADGSILRKSPARAGTENVTGLPVEALRVTLAIGDWRFSQEVDLSDGREGVVTFDLDPIDLRGRVFVGEKPVPARISFKNGTRWVVVKSGDDGAYQTLLWYSGVYGVQVQAESSPGPPFNDAFRVIDHSGIADFHLPDNDYRVRVIDAGDQHVIRGAEVSVANLWADASQGEGALSQRFATDESGTAILPPMREGKVEIRVRAKGYRDGEAIEFVTDAANRTRRFDVPLRPLAPGGHLRVLLPDDSGAARAELWAFANLAEPPVWRGEADDGGVFDIPGGLSGALLLIRHARGATLIERWSGTGDDAVEVRMDSPAPPLVVRAAVNDDTAGNSARIAIWIGDTKLSGVPLSFATWSNIGADIHGQWTARNLPRQSIRLIAVALGSSASVDTASLDPMATRIDYPWSSPKAIRAVP